MEAVDDTFEDPDGEHGLDVSQSVHRRLCKAQVYLRLPAPVPPVLVRNGDYWWMMDRPTTAPKGAAFAAEFCPRAQMDDGLVITIARILC